MRSYALIAFAMALTLGGAATAADVAVFGPGGPAPAVKEAARAFSESRGTKVTVTAGPTPKWIDAAKNDADLIYSGSEAMMSDFVAAMDGQIRAEAAMPLYLRPASILVRPGNPRGISGITDLFKPGHRVMVVNGAGQTGLWEDIAGRQGDIGSVRALRANIAVFAANSAEAKTKWVEDTTLDAWIIWNIWQRESPDLADLVEIEPEYRIYRDTGIALTERGKDNPDARAFAEFLQGPEGAAIFQKWGWITGAP